MKILLVIWALIIITCCGILHFFVRNKTPNDFCKINIERVFWHEYNDYSIMYVVDKEVKTVRLFNPKEIVVKTDVAPSEPMWIRWEAVKENNFIKYHYVEIHIHSITDINGADWNHGKHGHGKTQVIAP